MTEGTLSGRSPARVRHLDRAPITEAVIDIQVQVQEGFEAGRLRELAAQIKETYPVTGTLRSGFLRIEFNEAAVKPNFERGELGTLVKTRDEKTQVQFRTNGFTVNRLKPYTSWEELYPETERLWRLYADFVKPAMVKRLATRYINRLDVPSPIADLRDYLVAPPVIPDALPQILHSYLTRLVIHDAERDLSAIITQGSEANPTNPDLVTILLDIDAFKMVELKPTEWEIIHRSLNNLRDFKNQIFFGSITQTASELYE